MAAVLWALGVTAAAPAPALSSVLATVGLEAPLLAATQVLYPQGDPPLWQEVAARYRQRWSAFLQVWRSTRSRFLADIAERTGLGTNASLTLCEVGGVCWDYRGDVLPPHPASLSKVPLALVVLLKAQAEGISLDRELYIDPGNYTESKGVTWTGESYPLKDLVTDAIANSSNIASNQLIDYLGFDAIERTLQAQGFENTRIGFKFVGDEILPSNPGLGGSQITSNELTEMMARIYSYQYPNARLLIDALQKQSDRALGYQALERLPVTWLGEKTGQTSEVLGTTLAVGYHNKVYVLTVIGSYTNDEGQIRDCVRGMAEYIVNINALNDA